MNEQQRLIAAVIASGVAEVALTAHMDFESTMLHREALGRIMVTFGRAYIHALGLADLGVDAEDYVNGPSVTR